MRRRKTPVRPLQIRKFKGLKSSAFPVLDVIPVKMRRNMPYFLRILLAPFNAFDLTYLQWMDEGV